MGLKFCWPVENGNNAQDYKADRKFDSLGREVVYGDLVDAWKIYLMCIGFTIILSFAFLKALEACAMGMIKFMIALYTVAMIGLGCFLFYNYMTMVNKTEIR